MPFQRLMARLLFPRRLKSLRRLPSPAQQVVVKHFEIIQTVLHFGGILTFYPRAVALVRFRDVTERLPLALSEIYDFVVIRMRERDHR